MKDLPSQLAEIGAAAQALGEAIDLYQACVGFVCERYRGPGRSRVEGGGDHGATSPAALSSPLVLSPRDA